MEYDYLMTFCYGIDETSYFWNTSGYLFIK